MTAIVNPYADEHGLRRMLPEHAIAEAKRQFRWHQFTEWTGPKVPPTPDACGNCGKPESVHPIPWAPLEGYLGGALLVELFGLTHPVDSGSEAP